VCTVPHKPLNSDGVHLAQVDHEHVKDNDNCPRRAMSSEAARTLSLDNREQFFVRLPRHLLSDDSSYRNGGRQNLRITYTRVAKCNIYSPALEVELLHGATNYTPE
jgi:hypothetical protein